MKLDYVRTITMFFFLRIPELNHLHQKQKQRLSVCENCYKTNHYHKKKTKWFQVCHLVFLYAILVIILVINSNNSLFVNSRKKFNLYLSSDISKKLAAVLNPVCFSSQKDKNKHLVSCILYNLPVICKNVMLSLASSQPEVVTYKFCVVKIYCLFLNGFFDLSASSWLVFETCGSSLYAVFPDWKGFGFLSLPGLHRLESDQTECCPNQLCTHSTPNRHSDRQLLISSSQWARDMVHPRQVASQSPGYIETTEQSIKHTYA